MNFYNIVEVSKLLSYHAKANFIANRTLETSHGKGGQCLGRLKQKTIAIGHGIIVKEV